MWADVIHQSSTPVPPLISVVRTSLSQKSAATHNELICKSVGDFVQLLICLSIHGLFNTSTWLLWMLLLSLRWLTGAWPWTWQRTAGCTLWPFLHWEKNITLDLNIASDAWRRTQPYRFCLDEHHFLFVRQGIRVCASCRSRAEQVGWANGVEAPMLLVIVVVAHSSSHCLSALLPLCCL